MERNRWETAIRCLEVAVHPNTSDDEVMAGVNGFRRTAEGTPLRRVCREFAGVGSLGIDLAAWKAKFDRLEQENRELRQIADAADAGQAETLRRLQDAEQRVQETSAELRVAEHRADVAEQRLVEFQAAYGRISGGLHHENFDLRRALVEAKRGADEPDAWEPARPFRSILSAARERPDPAQIALAHRPASPTRGAPVANGAKPWTA